MYASGGRDGCTIARCFVFAMTRATLGPLTVTINESRRGGHNPCIHYRASSVEVVCSQRPSTYIPGSHHLVAASHAGSIQLPQSSAIAYTAVLANADLSAASTRMTPSPEIYW